MAKVTLTDVTSGYNVAGPINDNNEAIAAAVENTLSRDGTSPNEMEANLDMGDFKIINLGAPINDNDAVRLVDLAAVVAGGGVVISPTVAWATGITGIPATVTDIGNLVDPNVDRLVFWDDSGGHLVYLTLGTGLSITGTTISSTAASVAYAGITGLPAYITSLGLLVDPNADRLIFWDDSAGNIAQATISTGLNMTGTTLTFNHLGIQALVDPNADRILFWDDSAGSSQWLSVGTGLSITGTTLSLGTSLSSLGALTDPNVDALVFWDDSAGNYANLAPTGHLAITGTNIAYASTTGTFVGTLTGVTTVITGTVKYTINGNTVTLEFPDLVGTANSTAHTITGAPAAIFPTTAQRVGGVVVSNNTIDEFARLVVETTGVLTLHHVLNPVFTGAGTEGLRNGTITFHRS